MLKINKVYKGDCLEVMPLIDDKSIDMILCDLPYGSSGCKWDIVIPFNLLWEQYKRIIKGNGIIVLTALQPFTSLLICSNIKMFKYSWIWDKKVASNSQLAKFQPLKIHEDILVFYNKKGVYNPQGVKSCNIIKSNKKRHNIESINHIIGSQKRSCFIQTQTNYPKSIIIEIANVNRDRLHPTQKPVALFEYLIRTYSNKDNLVLDNCAGSGTTAIACMNTGRNYILIEKDRDIYLKAKERIKEYENRKR